MCLVKRPRLHVFRHSKITKGAVCKCVPCMMQRRLRIAGSRAQCLKEPCTNGPNVGNLLPLMLIKKQWDAFIVATLCCPMGMPAVDDRLLKVGELFKQRHPVAASKSSTV